MSCDQLVQIILKEGWKDPKLFEDEKRCVIDFRHPKIKPEEPVSYFLSSVDFDKEKNVLKATVRSKVDNYKEVYLEPCCENGENVCKPHVDMENKTFSVEATFSQKPIERFQTLLTDLL
jgi:hypothetical protein